jgi:hypothetical protein
MTGRSFNPIGGMELDPARGGLVPEGYGPGPARSEAGRASQLRDRGQDPGDSDQIGGDPDLDYREVTPELQQIRGPSPIMDGIAAGEKHLGLDRQPEVPRRPG